MRIQLSLILSILVLLGCTESKPVLPAHDDFSIGMTQNSIQQRFGKPAHKTTFTKNGPVWGELENIWDSLPEGSVVDVWSYRSSSESGNGDTELYFLNGATTVFSIGFSPAGVVYESNGS